MSSSLTNSCLKTKHSYYRICITSESTPSQITTPPRLRIAFARPKTKTRKPTKTCSRNHLNSSHPGTSLSAADDDDSNNHHKKNIRCTSPGLLDHVQVTAHRDHTTDRRSATGFIYETAKIRLTYKLRHTPARDKRPSHRL